MLSFAGLVSSNLKLTGALNFSPKLKLIAIAFTCPMCKYPLGSGGKRNRNLSAGKPASKSALIICSIKCKDSVCSDMNIFFTKISKKKKGWKYY